MYRRLISRTIVILLWILISVGIYQCSGYIEDKTETLENDSQSEQQIEEPKQEKPALVDNMRVLIKTAGHKGIYHDSIELQGSSDMHIIYEGKTYLCKAGETVEFTAEQIGENSVSILPTEEKGKISIVSVARAEKVQYRGKLDCYGEQQGIVIVNELPLEEYLYGVLPSEMPSSYPLEALKAQAISARTYAVYHMKSYAYPKWQAYVDDSTTYQVYLNIGETEQVRRAVEETRDQVMTFQNQVIESFYYAASSGYSTGYEVWDTEEKRGYLQIKALTKTDLLTKQMQKEGEAMEIFSTSDEQTERRYRDYITYGRSQDIEYQEPWYRWTYEKIIDAQQLLQRIGQQYQNDFEHITVTGRQEENSDENLVQNLLQEDSIIKIEVVERLESGLVNQLEIETPQYRILCRTQQVVRQVLATPGDIVVKQDNSTYTLGELLPSGYFYVDAVRGQSTEIEQLMIKGGGFGHGAGMSQNGAKCLALEGMTAQEILKTYYSGIELKSRGENKREDSQ